MSARSDTRNVSSIRVNSTRNTAQNRDSLGLLPRPRADRRGMRDLSGEAVKMWRLHQSTMQLPAPANDRRFQCELLAREDTIELKRLAQFGDTLSQREAWCTIARMGDSNELAGLVLLTGPAPMYWMSDSYYLYTPQQVAESTVSNALASLDAEAVAKWIAQGVRTYSPIPDLVQRRALNPEVYPIDVVLARCVTIGIQDSVFTVDTILGYDDLVYISQLYSQELALVETLVDILTLQARNDSQNEINIFNARWLAMYAPWCILNSSHDIQDALFEYYDPYLFMLRHGRSSDKKRLLALCDATRLRLSQHVIGEVNLPTISGDVAELSFWASE